MKIVLTGGGTAGHVVPNLALIPYLKNYFNEVYYIGSTNGIENQLVTSIPFYTIDCVKFVRKSILKNLAIPVKLIKSVNASKKILRDIKPDVVFSKGGYVGLPVVIASKKLGIPAIGHESDITVGLANKISAKYTKEILTSFKPTATILPNGRYVGPPLKDGLGDYPKTKARLEFNFTENKPVLFVFGGSLGAKALNDAVKSNLLMLLKKYNVLHVTGKNGYDGKIKAVGYTEIPYLNDMSKGYSVADVVVSRCGSNSAFEIISLKKPVVFVPLPKGVSRGDQELNANYFKSLKLCTVLEEQNLNGTALLSAIEQAINLNKNQSINTFTIDNANKKIAEILYKTALNAKKAP